MLAQQNKKTENKKNDASKTTWESLKYLLHQGLAIRGHSNNDEGNLDQLLLLRKNDVPDLDAYLQAKKYLSPEIINDQIALMANQLLRSLLDDIKANQCDQPFFCR